MSLLSELSTLPDQPETNFYQSKLLSSNNFFSNRISRLDDPNLYTKDILISCVSETKTEILVIDDEIINQIALTSICKYHWKLKVDIAYDGLQGYQKYL